MMKDAHWSLWNSRGRRKGVKEVQTEREKNIKIGTCTYDNKYNRSWQAVHHCIQDDKAYVFNVRPPEIIISWCYPLAYLGNPSSIEMKQTPLFLADLAHCKDCLTTSVIHSQKSLLMNILGTATDTEITQTPLYLEHLVYYK